MRPLAAQYTFGKAHPFNQALAAWDVSAVTSMSVRGRRPVAIAVATVPQGTCVLSQGRVHRLAVHALPRMRALTVALRRCVPGGGAEHV